MDRRSVTRLPIVAAAILALSLFALLTVYVVADGHSHWDRWLFRHLYSGESDWGGLRAPGQDNPSLNAAEPVLYRLADARALALLAAAVLVTLVLMKRIRSAAFFAAAVSVAALVPVLKELVDRPSPFPMPDDPSFPSGHATASMAIAAGIVVVVPPGRWRWVAGIAGAILVTVVGLAVVTDSGHWPSDVLAGWCLALGWVAALTALAGHRLEGWPTRNSRGVEPERPTPGPANISSTGSV